MTNQRCGTVAFLGAGNMAEALVRGLLAGPVCDSGQLVVTDVRPERLAYFQSTFGVSGTADNNVAVAQADVVFLAVKPQQLREVAEGLTGHLKADALVLSIAAGVRTATLEQWLGPDVRVVRAMPNTPALVGAGITAICGGRRATAADLALAETLLRAVGAVLQVNEPDMDAVTAVSGSGPAYVFLFHGSADEGRAATWPYFCGGAPVGVGHAGRRDQAGGAERRGAGGIAGARDLQGRYHRGRAGGGKSPPGGRSVGGSAGGCATSVGGTFQGLMR